MSVAAKICGISSEEAVAAAAAGGAAYVGFVFYPPSPRAVNATRAAQLCAALPGGVRRVGLFVDADDPTIAAVLDRAPLDLLQFHGHETPERVAEAKARCCPRPCGSPGPARSMSPPGSSTAPATRIQRKSANSSKWRGSFKSPQRHREEKTCSHRATAVRNGKKSSVTSVSLWCIFPRCEADDADTQYLSWRP